MDAVYASMSQREACALPAGAADRKKKSGIPFAVELVVHSFDIVFFTF
ncbi:MAG: hypothetical protein GF398_13170 [Chitinivibrionales bacterium]|nr:hypothetical protein [Chitinivibrionales bacterium]